jgi:uncharacterized membrane protein YgcG
VGFERGEPHGMADSEERDPMQDFYLRRRPEPPDEEPVSFESRPLPPLAPIRFRWMGLVIVVWFVLLLVVVARLFGSVAAQVLVVVALLGLAATTVVSRRRRGVPDGEGMWGQLHAEGVGEGMDGDAGFDGDAGGGDSGGGGE